MVPIIPSINPETLLKSQEEAFRAYLQQEGLEEEAQQETEAQKRSSEIGRVGVVDDTRARLRLAKLLWNWQPHSLEQADWFLASQRTKVAACGRRFGKSESSAVDISTYFLQYPDTFQCIIAPEYSATQIIFSQVVELLLKVPGMIDLVRYTNSPPFVIEYKRQSGKSGYIVARTANRDARGVRGYKFHRVFVDEAAFVADMIVEQVIEPTLADFFGQLVLISTPSGMGHFYRYWMMGQNPQFKESVYSIQLPTEINPYIRKEFLDTVKARVAWRTWLVEYMAQFLSDAGGVFRNIFEAIDTSRVANERPIEGRQYSIGWDLARKKDFSVVTAFDLATKRQVYFDRFNGLDWNRQVAIVSQVARLYNKAAVTMDSTGLGDPVYEMLRNTGTYTLPYQFSGVSKQKLIDNYALLIEQAVVSLMDNPFQTNELQIYESRETPSGRKTFSAPEGYNDDCVIAGALAAWGLAEGGSWWSNTEVRQWLLNRQKPTNLPERRFGPWIKKP